MMITPASTATGGGTFLGRAGVVGPKTGSKSTNTFHENPTLGSSILTGTSNSDAPTDKIRSEGGTTESWTIVGGRGRMTGKSGGGVVMHAATAAAAARALATAASTSAVAFALFE